MSSSNGRGGAGGVGGSSEHPQYPKVVLVTGACRFLGGYLTARLAQNPLINRVIAVDAIAPSKDMLRRMGRAEFVRADIRNPFIAKVIRNGEVDTVVHAAAASYAPRSGGSAALKELNVMGAMQLFAACQKAPSVRRVVLKSTSEVYGSSPHDPVMFTEDSSSRRPFSQGFPKDSLDIEGYVRALGRRRPDIAVTILRLANMIGPAMDTTLSRYLAGPLVPTIFGRDARLQLLHEQDALGALERAAMAGKAGTFNIGADGILMLSQAIRRAGRIPVPVPGFGVWALDSLRRAEKASGATGTICTQQGASSPRTGLASARAASVLTSPPVAKNTAAGARTAARTADDFRRSLANSCRPTLSRLRQDNGRINI